MQQNSGEDIPRQRVGGIRASTNCGGYPRLFAELTKRPQVPAKSGWPCATKNRWLSERSTG